MTFIYNEGINLYKRCMASGIEGVDYIFFGSTEGHTKYFSKINILGIVANVVIFRLSISLLSGVAVLVFQKVKLV